MHLISGKMLREFARLHPDAKKPLEAWFKIAKKAEWTAFKDIKEVFGKRVDGYDKFLIFDIGGNKYRLIVVPHYNRGKLFVRHVLTHSEYDTEDWKND